MLDFLQKTLEFFGSNLIILGICSLLGIVSFVITVLTLIKTAKITKILKYNSITSQYNKARSGFQKTFCKVFTK